MPGEVVIVHDENHPRRLWKLGKVTDVMTIRYVELSLMLLLTAKQKLFIDQSHVCTHLK